MAALSDSISLVVALVNLCNSVTTIKQYKRSKPCNPDGSSASTILPNMELFRTSSLDFISYQVFTGSTYNVKVGLVMLRSCRARRPMKV